MKIAYVLINANRFEGTSRAVVEVAERLAREHEVHLLSRTAVDVDLSHLQWHRIPGPAWPDVAEFEVFRQRADLKLKNHRFDVVHAAGCVALHADVYAIQTVHPKKLQATDPHQRNVGAGMGRRFTRWLYDRRVIEAEEKAYVSAGTRGQVGYLPVSSGTESELRACYPVEGALVDVIPNGADLQKFSPRSKEKWCDPTRRELGLSKDHFVVLFAGGEWHRKGLQLAIEAIAAANDSKLRLVVAGQDPQAADYRDLARRLGVDQQIRWLGFRSDIDHLYAAADVFLFPSSYEAFSLATIEAASAGLPVVMCDVSGAAELVGDGRGGRLVARNGSEIASALVELSSDPELCHQLSDQARSKVEAQFNWDLIAEKTVSFYQRLIESRSAADVGTQRRIA